MIRRFLLYKVPTYTAPTAKSLTYNGGVQLLLNAGSTSDGIIQYSSDNSTWSSGMIPTGESAASYTVYWRLIGDNTHSDIPSKSISVTINKYTPIPPRATTYSYNENPRNLVSGGSTSFGTMVYSKSSGGPFTTTIPQETNAGNYYVYWKVTGNTNVNNTAATQVSCSIAKANGSVINIPTATSNLKYGSNGPLCSDGSGTGTMLYSLNSPSSWSTSIPAATTAHNVGSYTVYYKASASTNYNESSTGSVHCTISKADGYVSTRPSGKSVTYGSNGALCSAGSGSGTMLYSLNNTYSWSTSIPSASTSYNVGSYTIYYRASASTNYNASNTGATSCSITKANGSVTNPPTAGSNLKFGNGAYLCTTGNGTGTMLYGINTSSPSSTSRPTTSQVSTAGNTTVNYRASASTNYNASSVGSLSVYINKGDGSVSTHPTANTNIIEGDDNYLCTAGSGTGTMLYSLNNTSSWSTSRPKATNLSAGTYAVYYKASASTNYNESSFSHILCTVGSYSEKYLTFKATESGTFKLSGNSVSYSVDNGSTWTTLASNTNTPTVTSGNKILWKATGLTPQEYKGIGRFSSTGAFEVEGNSMSLLYGDNFSGQTSLEGKNNAFYGLFSGCTGMTNAENLLLPATTLAQSCYNSMFSGCTSLTTAPELPATTLADGCYYGMFVKCTSLTTAPELPATTLASDCYHRMFEDCRSLTTAPELPATTLANYCYQGMFAGCTSLTTAPELPATTLAIACYSNMFNGCSNLTTAPELPATTLADGCYAHMFRSCTSLTTAPELPATTLVEECYGGMFVGCTSLIEAPSSIGDLNTTMGVSACTYMFSGCTSLTKAPELPATTMAYYCYYGMFVKCTSLTTAPELPATTLASDCYKVMFINCSNINSITCLATDINANRCTEDWLYGVSSSGDFYGKTAAGWTTGTSGIPTGWNFIDSQTEYLTFKATESGTFKLSGNSVSYSLDNGSTWTTLASDTNSPTVSAGSKIMWKATLTPASAVGVGTFSSTGAFEAEGNPMSLLYGDNFSGQTSLSGKNYAFYGLFNGCTGLTSISHMALRATTLSSGCYWAMFGDCTNLTNVTELPATTLANSAYTSMFSGCTSLTTVPNNMLPATTLATRCYRAMFYQCTNLTTAPELPATTLKTVCYFGMFNGCRSLTTAPDLPATTVLAACYYNMFKGCTSLTTAPELPAATVAASAYTYMFSGCTNLNSITCLATDRSASSATTGWVKGVASSGTFIKSPSMTGWTTGNSGIPTGWEVTDDYVEIGGIKWATMNVGASSITDYGKYFQWGDISGYTADQVGTDKIFSWADYEYGNGTSSPGETGMTKYNSTDGKTVLDLSDDAARANWGGNWRIPTTEEFQALGDATTSAWTADYEGSGVAGLVCTDKTDSSKVLFFPAAGSCYYTSVSDVGSYGYYWSSSLYSDKTFAYGLGFSNGFVLWHDNNARLYGLAVRPVIGNS